MPERHSWATRKRSYILCVTVALDAADTHPTVLWTCMADVMAAPGETMLYALTKHEAQGQLFLSQTPHHAGQTEMNVYLGHNAFGSEGFQDPLL